MPKTKRAKFKRKSQKIHRYTPINLKTSRQLADKEYRKTANLVLYWSTILFLTLMNFLMALVLIPFLLAAGTAQLYTIILIFGLLFGYIFNILITRIETVERHHHLFAAVFIPFIAVITLFTILSSLGNIASVLNITIGQNPRITMLIYIAAFLAPYVFTRISSLRQTK